MRATYLYAVACLLVLAGPMALAELKEPAPNHGATEVEVTGTKVRAEAWAVAHGHEVEAIVVARLMPGEGEAAPVVETYERWSLDGRKKLERGNRKLGKEWEKHLWAILEEVEKAADPKAGRKPRKKGSQQQGQSLSRAAHRCPQDPKPDDLERQGYEAGQQGEQQQALVHGGALMLDRAVS